MLSDKLEQASRDASRTRLTTVLLVSVVVVAGVVLFGVGVQFFPGNETDHKSGDGSAFIPLPQQSSNGGGAAALPDGDGGQAGGATTVQPSGQTPSVPDPPKAEDAPKQIHSNVLRENFKQNLRAFEEALEPKTSSKDFVRWNEQIAADIGGLKAGALNAFSTSDYSNGISLLEEATKIAEQALSKRKNEFDQLLSEAQKHYQKDGYAPAQLTITKALDIFPVSTKARQLAERIEALPPLLKVLKAASVARAENNPDMEIRLLKKAGKLAPERGDIKSRVSALRTILAERQFAAYVQGGLDHIEERDPVKAQALLSKAETIFPKRAEIRVLRNQLLALVRALQIEENLNHANRSLTDDDWQMAKVFFGKALNLDLANTEAKNGVEMATKIITAKEKLGGHLSSPHRLAATNVAGAARQLLKDVSLFTALSPSLRARAAKLQDLMDAYSEDVKVRVLSDGKTHIIVRGVGVVGKATERTINLLPGDYVFEGERQGFKAVLREVHVRPGTKTFDVEIVCDEPI